MLHNLCPKSSTFLSQVFILLCLCTQQRSSVHIEFFFCQLINVFFQYFVHKSINISSQFMRVFYVGLNQNRHAQNASVVIWKRHYNVPQLLFRSQVIESWLLNEGLSQILKSLCSHLECFVLEMDDNGAVCFLFRMKDFLDNWKLV